MQFLVTTTTTTHVLLPKGRHTAARQRVKAARQFSGWSPAARLSRSPRSSASDPPAHEWLAKIFVMPPTLLSLPLHVAQHHSRGTARDEVLTLPSRPLSRHHARSSGFPRPHVSPGVCLSHILKKMYLVLTESPRQGISVGPFCSSTSRSKSRPVCLTNVRHWRPMRGSQVLLASFSLTHARPSGLPRPA